jgi:bifunctional non-homologous end joining protein LigD
MLPKFQPMPLGRLPKPFSDPDWFFEIKWDGFRALAYVEHGKCKLISRNGNEFKSFPALNLALPLECQAKSVVLDGEIVCLDENGTAQFEDLLFHRGEPRFQAFDLLFCDGEDLRYLPLTDRKHRLRGLVPKSGQRLLYSDHVELRGEKVFEFVCKRDIEGIVAKRKFDPYLLDGSATWLKIRNRNYSQWIGREELFERERGSEVDCQGWSSCALVCEDAGEPSALHM